MIASERLKELDGAMTTGPWPLYSTDGEGEPVRWPGMNRLPHYWAYYLEGEDEDGIIALRNALPLIADVVEAAEQAAALWEHMAYDEYGDVHRTVDAARSAVTALQEALNGSAGEAVSSPAKKLAGSGETALNARLDDSGRLSSDSPHISKQESSRSAGDGGVT